MQDNTVRVRFIDVGRDRKTWTATLAEDPNEPGLPSYDAMLRSIRKSGALRSREIAAEDNDEGTGGRIYAGMRLVGRWEIDRAAAQSAGAGEEK